MDIVRQSLSSIGLTDHEISVYLFLITQDLTPSSTIANQLNITRSSSYDILKSLSEKGLVTSIEQNDSLKFSAEPPENLLNILEKNKKEISEQKEILEIIEEEINNQFLDKDNTLKVKHMPIDEFNNEYQKLYKYLDSEKDIIRSLASGQEENIEVTSESISDRIKYKIPLKLLISKNEDTIKYQETDKKEIRETIYFDQSRDISIDMTIAPTRIDIEDEKSGYYTTIENKNIVETVTNIFDICFKNEKNK